MATPSTSINYCNRLPGSFRFDTVLGDKMEQNYDNPDDLDTPFMPEKCPKCRGIRIMGGYGLAGGGIGIYKYCEDCGTIFDKVQDAHT